MKSQQVREALRQTLDDHRLSRAERKALDEVLEHLEISESLLDQYRAIAFELAADEVDDPNAVKVIHWLESVMKLLASKLRSQRSKAVAETHFGPDESCPRRIANFIHGAKESVDICVFTITDDRISAAIVEAHDAGRRVRVLTDDETASDPGSDIESLIRQGVDVRKDHSRALMHHKFALVDGLVLLTGSYNWTRAAARENAENFVITSDYRFVDAFSRQFEKLWKTAIETKYS